MKYVVSVDPQAEFMLEAQRLFAANAVFHKRTVGEVRFFPFLMRKLWSRSI